MGKRKKKSKKRKAIAISVFGLKGMTDYYETETLYQSKFHDSDMVWLADEYQKRSSSEPSLTLEEFAAYYGVSADELRSHVPDLSRDVSHSMILWHGTTASRARSIIREGFRAKKAKKQRRIFFAGRPSMAQGIAQARAEREGDQPAVIKCSIDLSHYSDFERRGNAVYAFRDRCIGSEVIVEVTGPPGQRREKQEKAERREDTGIELTNVALTFNSGCAGIAYWVNSCLRLNGSHRIDEDHEAVGKIKQWLDDQIDAGRFGEVPSDEMLEQVQKYLPEYLT
jgi:hypothetical protein